MSTLVPGAPRQDLARKIIDAIGIEPEMVAADSITLEPFGKSLLVRWEGAAIMDAASVAALFTETHDREEDR